MTDVAVIGAGIIGLATARDLLVRRPDLQVTVLEKEAAVARHQSGRNSGVLHSGLYYQPGSLKARLCRAGADRMVAFCREHGVELTQSGKVVVATDGGQVPRLEALAERGRANGVTVRSVDRSELAEIEPHVRAVAALHVPETGVVEYGRVCDELAADLRRRGGRIETGAAVEELSETRNAVRISYRGGDLEARLLVNCAGLYSDRVARLLGLDPEVRIVPFRGEYFEITGRSAELVRSAVYPVADPRLPFLGVHLTRRASGVVEAGPNAVLALAREGYTKTSIDGGELWEMLTFRGTWGVARRFWRAGIEEYRRSLSARWFVRSVQTLVPDIAAVDMRPGTAGVRAQAVKSDGTLVDDFALLRGARSIHVLNSPSPAATASLSIAHHIGEEVVAAL